MSSHTMQPVRGLKPTSTISPSLRDGASPGWVQVEPRCEGGRPREAVRLAFYDFDGTLASGNVVQRYAYIAGRQPSCADRFRRQAGLLLRIPLFVGLNRVSRRRFNELFFREYRGLDQQRLAGLGQRLLDEQIRPTIFPAARAALATDRAEGYRLVLLSGELDLALRPVAEELGFDDLVCNRLVFRDGVANGEVEPPLLAEREKAAAIQRLCAAYGAAPETARAYSDSLSDLPMLEAVGQPFAVNPEGRLRNVARARGWPIVSWRGANHA